jgi:hypothetical protein
MTEAANEFDFSTWAARSYRREVSLHDALDAAIEQMVLGRGDLRGRLSHALFALCYRATELDIPVVFRRQFDEILAGVNRPLNRDTDIVVWTNAIRRMRLKKADRLVWKLWQLHRSARR